MENTRGSIYNYPIIEPFNCSKEQQAQNVMNGYLTFATNKNGPMYIGPAAQAHLLKELMEFLEVIKQSKKQFDIISKSLKFKSFEKYIKYFATNETNKKVKLIKVLYKALYNEKNPPQLTGVLPENMILIINLKTLNEICDYLLFSLYCLYNSKNSEQKLTSLLQGQMSWRDACMKKKFINSDEYNKYEKAMGYLDTLCCFSCFNLEITKNLSDEQNIVLENVLLFYIFYEALLKNCLKINIDMTIPKLDVFYSSLKVKKELYSMDEKSVIPRINDIYLKGILVNYLLMKRIGEHFEKKDGLLLTYQQYDSYIIELFILFQKEVLDIKDKEFSFECNLKNSNLLFYNVLYYLSPKTGFILELNALDPLLFKNIIYAIFIILSNGEPIQNVEISLFPKENLDYTIDIHKIYLNYVSYNNILKKRDIPNELQEIYYNLDSHDKFNWKNKDDLKLDVSENKIYDILFEDFNINLFYLLVLIDKNSQTLSEAIKINLPQCLLSKKKYVYATAYFIFNIFNFLYKKCLSINMSQFKLSSNIELPDSLCRFTKVCLRNLKINNLKLKVYNISYILDLNSLPYSTCSLLSLSNISYDDLVGLVDALRKKIGEETILKHLKLKFHYSLFINFNLIDDMFRNYSFPASISYVTIRFKNEFSTNEYFELMWKVINALANSENNPKELKVSIKLYYDEKDDPISFHNLKQNLTDCFDFEKLNPNYLILYNFNFRKIKDNKEIIVELNKYQRDTKLDAFIKLSRAMDKNQKLELKFLMPSCLRIIRFITKFEVYSNIKIHFVFARSR
jgi:hypothetical protein